MHGTVRIAHKSAAVVAAGALALVALALGAMPASADSDDIEVTKSPSAVTAGAGDTVTYTVQVDHVGGLLATDNNIVVTDTLPPHMNYVAGSSTATYFNYLGHIAAHGFNTSDYTAGTGWAGSWVETNDDGLANNGGIRITSTALRLRDDSGIAGLPSISRDVDLGGATAVNVSVAFGLLGVSVEGDDSVAVELSYDGGGSWTQLDSWTGDEVGLVPTPIVLTASGVNATAVAIRFSVLSGTDATDTVCIIPPSTLCSSVIERFAVSGLAVTVDTEQTWNDVGDPTTGVTDSSWDIGVNDSLTVTYDAVIDSVIPNDTVLLTNTATVTSDDDATGEVATSSVVLVRAPAVDVVTTNNGPVHIGSPLVITAHVSHSAVSDGAPICQFELHGGVTAPTAFTYVSGDADVDGCLDHGETWILTKAFAGMTTTAGNTSLALAATGYGPLNVGGAPEFDGDFEQAALAEYTVVLADSGPNDNTGLVVIATGLLAAGAALVLLGSRRQRA